MQDGGWQIGERLDVGNGEAFEVMHPQGPGRLALELVRAKGAAAAAVTAFCAEVDAAGALDHPNLLRTFGAGLTEDGTPYLIRELPVGETLRARLDRVGPLAMEETAAIVRGMAAALEAAHRHGLVHRDLRADDVLLVEAIGHEHGFVKLGGFGRWRLGAALDEVATRPALVAYRAPEQARGRLDQSGPAADQFALAALAYRMVAGVDPFRGEDAVAVLYQVVHEPPAPLATHGRGDPALDEVLLRGLAKDPAERFPSVMAFAAALTAAVNQALGPTPPRISTPMEVVHPRPTPVRPMLVRPTPMELTVAEPTRAMLADDEPEPTGMDDDGPVRVPRPRWRVPAALLVLAAAGAAYAWWSGWRPPQLGMAWVTTLRMPAGFAPVTEGTLAAPVAGPATTASPPAAAPVAAVPAGPPPAAPVVAPAATPLPPTNAKPRSGAWRPAPGPRPLKALIWSETEQRLVPVDEESLVRGAPAPSPTAP